MAKRRRSRLQPGDRVRLVKMPRVTPGPNEATLRRAYQALMGQEGVIQNNWNKFDKGGTVKFNSGKSSWMYPQNLQLIGESTGAPKQEVDPPEAGKFRRNQYVILKEFDNGDEVIPEQGARVLEYDARSDTYQVEIDEEDREGPRDDGIREVTEDQIKSSGPAADAARRSKKK